MKIIYSLLLIAFVSIQGIAQDAHIDFENSDWEAALKKAKEEDKIIFVDAFTTWCGPCKMMSKNVFTDPTVSKYFNKNFVNMKIDMEKGEGLLFAKAYGVKAYPTYVFVDARGNIAHKGLGYMEPSKFIEFGKSASDEENRLGALMKKYKKGDRSSAFLKQYAVGLKDSYDDGAAAIALEYLNTQEDWNHHDNAIFIVDMAKEDSNTELYQYMAKNRKMLVEHVDVKMMDQKLKYGIMRNIQSKKLDESEQKKCFTNVFPTRGAEYSAEYNMLKYARMQDEEMKAKYLNAASEYIDTYKITDWQTLNQVAWKFYETTDDKKDLKKACQWAITSVKGNSNYMNNDTAAALYFKLKDKKNAVKYAKEAIRIAQEEGQDFEVTTKLLEQIESL